MTDVVRKIRGETITLATSRAFGTVRGVPPGFNTVEVNVPNSTIEAISVGFGPKIKNVYFYDASIPRWIEYTNQATDRNTATVVDLSIMQTDDRLYVGAVRRYDGLSLDVVGTNGAGTANSVGEYPLGLVWTDLSITDGTDSTATFDQDGLITWTVPANTGWTAQKLNDVAGEALAAPETDRLFWTRLRPDAAITDTSVTVAEITALFNDTLNAATLDNEGQDDIRILSHNGGMQPYRLTFDPTVYGSIELISATLTSAAHINWMMA